MVCELHEVADGEVMSGGRGGGLGSASGGGDGPRGLGGGTSEFIKRGRIVELIRPPVLGVVAAGGRATTEKMNSSAGLRKSGELLVQCGEISGGVTR